MEPSFRWDDERLIRPSLENPKHGTVIPTVFNSRRAGQAGMTIKAMTAEARRMEVVLQFEKVVIPAKAGFSTAEWLVIQRLQALEGQGHWIPAFAGMTGP